MTVSKAVDMSRGYCDCSFSGFFLLKPVVIRFLMVCSVIVVKCFFF